MAQKQSAANRNQSSKRPQPQAKANASSRLTGKDIFHVIILAVIFTVLFTAVGVVISVGMGLPAASTVTHPQTPNTPGGVTTQVAVNGTPVPTEIPPTAMPSEIPCEAQVWWDSISAPTATVVNNVQALSINLKPKEIQSHRADLNTWKTSLESATLPACVQAAQTALDTAATDSDALYALYLTTSTLQQRGTQILKVMDSYLAATDELEKAGVTVKEDWFQEVRDFTRSDCPAKHWYIEEFAVKDYQRFFSVMKNINVQSSSVADKTNALTDVRTLSASLQADSASFPECVKAATDHFVKAMDEAAAGLNAGLNQDPSAMSAHLQAYISESGAFSSEVTKLDSTLINPQSPTF